MPTSTPVPSLTVDEARARSALLHVERCWWHDLWLDEAFAEWACHGAASDELRRMLVARG